MDLLKMNTKMQTESGLTLALSQENERKSHFLIGEKHSITLLPYKDYCRVSLS